MFVKVYRYCIQIEKIKQFLDIQERAKRIYDKHVKSRQLFLQNRTEPCQWLEIHWYPDEASYHHSQELINNEPEIHTLWLEFQTTLEPKDPTIHEDYYDEVWAADNLTYE